MKNLLLGVIAFISVTPAFAQTNWDCTVLLVDEPTNLIIHEPFYGVRNGRSDMCRKELRACNRTEHQYTNTYRTGCIKLDQYYPGYTTIGSHYYNPSGVMIHTSTGTVIIDPGPVVDPGPVITPRHSRATIIIEDQMVQLNSINPGDVYLSCLQLANNVINQIDEIMVTVGNGETIYNYNSSSYWSDSDSCTIVQNAVNASLAGRDSNRPVSVVGSIESTTLISNGPTKADVLADCFSVTRSIFGQIDELNVSINNSNINRIYNSSSYWSDNQTCRELMNLVDRISL